MWFDSWGDLVRVLVVGTAAYVTVVAVLRLSGKRTLAKLNAFDLIVTVALGSTLAEIRQAIRASGRGGLEDISAVVLETDGTLSVIGIDQFGSGSALDDVPDE